MVVGTFGVDSGAMMTLLMLAAVQPAEARYRLPEAVELVVTADSIVDATVTGFDPSGAALLDVHEVLAGEPITALVGVHYTCTRLMPEQVGLIVGRRYVFAADEGSLIEFSTAFRVRADGDVAFWTFEDQRSTAWQPMDVVRKAIAGRRKDVSREGAHTSNQR